LALYLAEWNLDTRSSSSICYREHLIMKTSTVKDSKFPTTSFQNKWNYQLSKQGYYILFYVLYFFLLLFPFGFCFYLFIPLLLGKEIIIFVQRLMDLLGKLQFDHVIIPKYPINLIFVIWDFGLSRNIWNLTKKKVIILLQFKIIWIILFYYFFFVRRNSKQELCNLNNFEVYKIINIIS